MTKIVVDAMGGDFAPNEQVRGAVLALKKDADLSVILVGDKPQIEEILKNEKYDQTRLEIVHTTQTISMEETPTIAVKTKKDSSLVVAFRMLKEGKADGLVSSGSTGAVLTAGVLILGRIKGVSRPALCPLIPNHRGQATFLCDCGANLECKPINLVHFAMMATAYAAAAYGIENPRVGLLNAILKKLDCVNYTGNVEGRDLMHGDIDVLVADGFTGNIAMKSVEGCGKAVSTIMKKAYKRNLWTKLRALISGDIIKGIKKGLDYESMGGATFLGLQKAVVKGHGNSKAPAISVCIAQAANAVRGDMVGKIKEMIDNTDMDAITAQITVS